MPDLTDVDKLNILIDRSTGDSAEDVLRRVIRQCIPRTRQDALNLAAVENFLDTLGDEPPENVIDISDQIQVKRVW